MGGIGIDSIDSIEACFSTCLPDIPAPWYLSFRYHAPSAIPGSVRQTRVTNTQMTLDEQDDAGCSCSTQTPRDAFLSSSDQAHVGDPRQGDVIVESSLSLQAIDSGASGSTLSVSQPWGSSSSSSHVTPPMHTLSGDRELSRLVIPHLVLSLRPSCAVKTHTGVTCLPAAAKKTDSERTVIDRGPPIYSGPTKMRM